MSFCCDAFEQLNDRGFIFQATNLEEVKRVLKKGPITFYLGIDPTADDLHIGHFFGLQMARILQDYGHRCIILVGGATALIGDPSGKKDMRKMLTKEQVEHNAFEIKNLIKRFVKTDGDNPAVIVDNGDWLKKEPYIDFLRNVGCYFNINEMLAKDLYKNRLAQGGLTFMELGYMLMQAFDFVYLNDKYNCILEIGGSDQWGNIVAGTELSRKMNFNDGTQRPIMMGLTCPLLTNAEGVKMGKTEKGTLWVSRDKTTAYEFYQHFINCLDADVERLLRFFTKININEIKKMCAEDIVNAKKIMAFEVTKLVHGEGEAQKAKQTSEDVFANGGLSEDMPSCDFSKKDFEDGKSVLDLLVECKLAQSRGEAKRLILGGGVSFNKNKICDIAKNIFISDLDEKGNILQKGKKSFIRINIINE